MFRRKVMSLDEVLKKAMRLQGLEGPLHEKRLLDAWAKVMPEAIVRYTGDKFIKNQTLWIKIKNPALRQDLSMQKSQIVPMLNKYAGANVIFDIHFY